MPAPVSSTAWAHRHPGAVSLSPDSHPPGRIADGTPYPAQHRTALPRWLSSGKQTSDLCICTVSRKHSQEAEGGDLGVHYMSFGGDGVLATLLSRANGSQHQHHCMLACCQATSVDDFVRGRTRSIYTSSRAAISRSSWPNNFFPQVHQRGTLPSCTCHY